MSFLGIIGHKTKTIEKTGFAPLLGEPKDTFKSIVTNAIVNNIDMSDAILDSMYLRNPVSDKNWEYTSKISFHALTRKTIQEALQRAGVVPDTDENGNYIYKEGNPLLFPEIMHEIMKKNHQDLDWVGQVVKLKYGTKEIDFKITGQTPKEIKIDKDTAKIYITHPFIYESVGKIKPFKGAERKVHQTKFVYSYKMEPPEGFAEVSFFIKANGEWKIFDSEEFFKGLKDTDKYVIDKVVPLKVDGKWVAKSFLLQKCGIVNADELQEQLGKNKDVQIEYGILGTFLQWKIETDKDEFQKLFNKLWFKVIDYYAPEIDKYDTYTIKYETPGERKIIYEVEAKTEMDDTATDYSREIKKIFKDKGGISYFYGLAFIVKGEKKKITFIPRAIRIILTNDEVQEFKKVNGLIDDYNIASGIGKFDGKNYITNSEATSSFRYKTEDIENKFFIPIPSSVSKEFKFKDYVNLYPAMFGMLYHTEQKITYTTVLGIKSSDFFKAIGVVLTFISAGSMSPAMGFLNVTASMALQAGLANKKIGMVLEAALIIYGLYNRIEDGLANAKSILDTLNAAMNLYDIYIRYELQSELSDFRKFKSEIEKKIEEYKNTDNINVIIIEDIMKSKYDTYYSFATDIMYLQDIIWNQLFQEQGMPDEAIIRQFKS